MMMGRASTGRGVGFPPGHLQQVQGRARLRAPAAPAFHGLSRPRRTHGCAAAAEALTGQPGAGVGAGWARRARGGRGGGAGGWARGGRGVGAGWARRGRGRGRGAWARGGAGWARVRCRATAGPAPPAPGASCGGDGRRFREAVRSSSVARPGPGREGGLAEAARAQGAARVAESARQPGAPAAAALLVSGVRTLGCRGAPRDSARASSGSDRERRAAWWAAGRCL